MMRTVTGVALVAMYCLLLGAAFQAPRVSAAGTGRLLLVERKQRTLPAGGPQRAGPVPGAFAPSTSHGECLSLESEGDSSSEPVGEVYPTITTFQTALAATGMDVELQNWPSNVTVFAPTNEAIATYLEKIGVTDTPDAAFYSEDKDASRKWIRALVVRGGFPESALQDDTQLNSLYLTKISVKRDGDDVDVLGGNSTAKIVQADVPICNGFVQIVDTVLLPTLLGPWTNKSNSTLPAGSGPDSISAPPSSEEGEAQPAQVQVASAGKRKLNWYMEEDTPNGKHTVEQIDDDPNVFARRETWESHSSGRKLSWFFGNENVDVNVHVQKSIAGGGFGPFGGGLGNLIRPRWWG